MKTSLRVVFIAAIIFAANIAAATNVPFLTGRVTDNAETLSEPMRKSLTERLKAHEDRTGNQIAVLTIPSLEGESIEEYAEAVFREWKLGQKGKDNGILVVVALNDRRMRIEVGYGLEGALTDLLAGRIIQNVMTPKFKTGDYDGGIDAGVSAIIELLENGKAPDFDSAAGSETKTTSSSGIDAPDMPLTQRILFGAFIFGIIGLFTVVGIMTPDSSGWFLYFFLIPFWAMFPIIIVGTSGALYLLITYLIVYPVAKLLLSNTDWYKKAATDLRTKGHASIGGFSLSSGSSGSSWSSGSSGSSGFSGGGGSSGGGGASGGW